MLGIVLGGVLTTFVGWPYIFYINLPIGAVALWFGLKYIKTDKKVREPLDLKGMAVLSLMLVLLTLSSTEIVSVGISADSMAMLAAGIVLIPVFVMIEKRVKFPTIDFGAFSNKLFAHSIAAAFLQSMGYLSIVFVLIMYLQGVRGLNPLDASVLLIPGYLISGLTGPYMGRLSDKLGARHVTTAGLILMLSSIFIYLAILNSTTPYYQIVIATIVSGIGVSMFFPSNSSAVMSSAPSNNYGVASGILRSLSNIGTLCSYLMTVTVASIAVSRAVAFRIFLGTSDLTGNISNEFVAGMHAVFIIAAIIIVIAIIFSALRSRSRNTNGSRRLRNRSQVHSLVVYAFEFLVKFHLKSRHGTLVQSQVTVRFLFGNGHLTK